MARRSFLWPDPRVKPPFGAAELDRGHPLARGLVACWLFNERAGRVLRDMTGLQQASITDATNTLWREDRIQSVTNAGTTIGATISPGLALSIGVGTWSWEGRITPTSGDSYGALFVDAGGSNGMFFRPSLGKMSYYTSTDKLSTTAITLGTTHHYVMAMNATNGTHYLDGRADGTFINGIGMTATSMFNDSISETYSGTCDFQRVWNDRALTAGDALWLASEPFAMFRPVIRRRYVVPAAAAASTTPAKMYQYRTRRVA